MSEFFVDFHCHPSLKPYGKSFGVGAPGENNNNRRKKNSVWYYDSPNLFERGLQLFTGISKFTQADCTTLAYGNVRMVCASLYPIEKGFFSNKLGTDVIGDLANDFVTGLSIERVNHIQETNDYFQDVQREYEFYRQLDGTFVNTDAGKFKYLLINSYKDIENYEALNPNDEKVIFIAFSIEGLHALLTNMSNGPDEISLLNNLKTLKQWQHVPYFVTVAHHFYNHLCGHAKSLYDIVGSISDQSEGMGTGFTDLGKKVLREVLSTTNGKRIHIDIKHMSALSRKEYFNILATDFANEKIPVIVSHGAANGLRSMDEKVVDGLETGNKLLAEEINFYDNEILMVANTGGVFCLQLDERRLASKATLKNVKNSVFMNKIRHYRAELLWNQVQHIAELLDRNNLFAWDCMAIGSDFDGVINPLNGFLTEETLPHLQEYLERYIFNYMNDRGRTVLKSFNQLGPSEIVNRIFSSNGREFMRKWFL